MLISAVRLNVSEQGDNLKFEWSTQTHLFTPYCVNAERVRKAGEEVRSQLRAIADKYRGTGARYSKEDLKELAVRGRKLFAALFFATAGDDSSADYLSEKISEMTNRVDLTIFTDGNVTIPWNFIFRHDPNEIKELANDLSDFAGFWTTVFNPTVRFNKLQLPCESAISKKNLKTLFAVHEERFDSACQLLKRNPPLLEKLDKLLKQEVGETTNWTDCKDKWKAIGDNDSVVYIFGHSDGTHIYLNDPKEGEEPSEEYALDTTGFLTAFPKKRDSSSNTVCFINGCRTANGSLGDGFLSVTSGRGFHGFVGCEAEITNEFATEYAAEFLYLLCEAGLSISAAMELLRVRLFPLSLWYSCYADPEFRIE
jgi:hypothetical protein